MSADYGGLSVHPAADLFPLIQGKDFDLLVEDVRANGQMEPVVLDRSGRLIDGRNRVRACVQLGIEPAVRTFEGDDVVQFVVSHNLHRRHLTDSQRAMIAADLANIPTGVFHGNQWSPPSGGDRQVSRSEVKSLMQVSEGSLQRAKVINRDGIPALRDLAKETNAPLATLERVASTPPEEQEAYVEKVRAGTPPVKAAPPVASVQPVKPENLTRPQPPKFGGNRKKHAAVIDSIAISLSGLAMAADEITEFDNTVTAEEAARLADDLSTSIRSLNRLKQALTRKATP